MDDAMLTFIVGTGTSLDLVQTKTSTCHVISVDMVTCVQRHHIRMVSVSLTRCVENCTGWGESHFIIPTCGQHLSGLAHIMKSEEGLGRTKGKTFQEKDMNLPERVLFGVLQSCFGILRQEMSKWEIYDTVVIAGACVI